MEVEANYLFDTYRELYFDGGHSSVYFWDLDEGGFAATFLIKKVVEGGENVKRGSWDGIHVIEVTEKAGSSGPKQFTYKLTSTVMLHMNMDKNDCGKTTLAGNVTRQAEKTAGIDGERSHVGNMGSMVEDMESDMRQHLLAITYVEKMGDILQETRSLHDGKKNAISANAVALNAALGSAILEKKKE